MLHFLQLSVTMSAVISMKNNVEIGQRLKYARKRANLTLEELGSKLGVHKSTVSRWERGFIDNIGLATISKLSEVLLVNESWLSGKDVPMERDNPPALPKNILPLPPSKKYRVLGTIACGTPIEAVQESGEEFDFPEDVDADADVCLRCAGDSMLPVYRDGDIVFIRRQPQVENGQIAAVYVKSGSEWDVTLKKVILYPDRDIVILRALNPDFEDMIFTGEERAGLEVYGLAVALYRKT